MGRFFPAIAVASLLTGAALAETPDPPPPPAAAPAPTTTPTATLGDPREVNAVRIGAGGSYFRGSKIVGVGTRKPYAGIDGDLYLDMIRFPLHWFGFEIAMEGGMGTDEAIPLIFGIRSAVDFAPLRWTGRYGGSIIVGAGGGVEAGGDRTWLDEVVRAYPFFLARLRVFPTSAVALSASWHFVPVTTSLRLEERLLLQTHQIEAAASYGYLQLGARAYLSAATGGDPRRTYNEVRFGPFVGAVFY